MNSISTKFCRKGAVLLAIMFCFFIMCSATDTVLCGHVKKTKHAKPLKKKQLQRKYTELKEDYNYTVANFIVILDRVVNLCKELEETVQQLDDTVHTHGFQIQNLDAISLVHESKLLNIRDYLYQKSLDPTYCPFDMFKKWYEEPVHLHRDNFDGDRHNSLEDIDF